MQKRLFTREFTSLAAPHARVSFAYVISLTTQHRRPSVWTEPVCDSLAGSDKLRNTMVLSLRAGHLEHRAAEHGDPMLSEADAGLLPEPLGSPCGRPPRRHRPA